MFVGDSVSSKHYSAILLEKEQAYEHSLQEARTKELDLQHRVDQVAKEYEEELTSIKSSNDVLITRLHNQISTLNKRLSSATQSSTSSNDPSRESRVSEDFNKLIEFSDRCSRRADELITQVVSLQKYIKELHK